MASINIMPRWQREGQRPSIYEITLGIRILDLPTPDEKNRLFGAVSLRHDCVHRNGFDKDGKELDVFTKAFVQSTADAIKAFVDRIEQKVSERLI